MVGGISGGDPLAPSLGNSWRTTTDIQDHWASMISNIDNVKRQYVLYIYDCSFFSRTMLLLNLQDQVAGMILIVSYYFAIVD